MCHKKLLTPFLLPLVFLMGTFVVSHFAHAATITIVNLNGPGEGFNDPSPPDLDSTVGGNPGATLGEQRLIAFQSAADLWSTLLDSAVEIRAGAQLNPLFCTPTSAVLGSAGPTTAHRDFAGALMTNTWYPQALANSLAGTDLAPAADDIAAQFNSNLDLGDPNCLGGIGWYYGLDATPPGSKIDFVTVVLHELGHGLGFLTFVTLATGAKLSGLDDTYMLNLENHTTGLLYPNMTNAERVNASRNTGNLHWVGPNVVAASGRLTEGVDPNGHVEMYAPNPQQPGSSVSHFSNALSPDELMEPFFTGPNHNVGLALELSADIGWVLVPPPLNDTAEVHVKIDR